MVAPHRVLVCHAPTDAPHRDALLRQLQPLVERQVLSVVDHSIDCPAPTLDGFAAIVVMMSPEMTATTCLAATMLPAVPADTPILPVIVRRCAWEQVVRLSSKAALPRGLKPVEEHPDPDGVWRTVANGIRIACEPPEQEMPTAGKAERVSNRLAMMGLGLALAVAGPLWLWISGG